MSDSFFIKYEGSELVDGKMDALAVSQSIAGFNSFTQRVAAELYGEEAELEATISGFKSGSFEYEFITSVSEIMATAMPFTGDSQAFLNTVKEFFQFLMHIKGKEPRKVSYADNGSVSVENNQGEIIIINAQVLNIAADPSTSKNAQQFIRRPFSKGASSLTITANDNEILSATNDMVDYFEAVRLAESEQTLRATVKLTVQTVVLEGEAKWKFFNGEKSIYATMEDQEFLDSVKDGSEVFARGDIFEVRLRSEVKVFNSKPKTNHFIEEVKSHERTERGQTDLI